MAAEQDNKVRHNSDDMDRAALRFGIKKAKRGLRWLSVWPALARGLTVGLLCAAAWIVLIRFTLADVPAWPAVVFCSGCAIISVWWSLFRQVSASRAARFLDSHLSLDERVSTLLELQRSGSTVAKQRAASPLMSGMLDETSALLMERMHRLPRPTWWRASRREAVIIICALTLLGGSIVLPTPLDAVRSEQAALRRALETRLGDLEALRLEIAADPLIAPDAKAKLDAELWDLQRKLRTPGMSRSELVAALSDAEEKLRELTATPVSAFDSLLQAAQMILDRAANTSFWVEDLLVSETELSRAADAAGYLSRFATRFTVDEDRAIALTFDQSALLTGQTHPLFTADFKQAAEALRAENGTDATREIDQIARRFREADSALHTSQAMERTLSQLDESRHDVAQAGTVAKKRGQVGFRRRGTTAQPRVTPTSLATDSSGLPVANTPRPAQGIAPGSDTGPDAAGPSAQQGKTVTPGSSGPEGMPGPPQSGDTTKSSTGNPPGSGSTSQEDAQGPSKSGPGGGGEGDNPGTLQGPLTGPVGGTSGAISRVPNPQGSGTSGSGQSAGGSAGEEGGDTVSIPEPSTVDSSLPGGTSGDKGSAGQGGEGGQTVGDASDTEDRSSGGLTSVKTPYKEVVREYSERANKALERTYIPSDAKEYVKQYFTVLGQ